MNPMLTLREFFLFYPCHFHSCSKETYGHTSRCKPITTELSSFRKCWTFSTPKLFFRYFSSWSIYFLQDCVFQKFWYKNNKWLLSFQLNKSFNVSSVEKVGFELAFLELIWMIYHLEKSTLNLKWGETRIMMQINVWGHVCKVPGT